MPDLTDQHLKMMRSRDAARAWMLFNAFLDRYAQIRSH